MVSRKIFVFRSHIGPHSCKARVDEDFWVHGWRVVIVQRSHLLLVALFIFRLMEINRLVADATYLFKSLQGFQSKGLTPYAISIQNEPQNSDTTYPSCTMSVAVEAQIGMALRSMMNNNGFGAVKIIGIQISSLCLFNY